MSEVCEPNNDGNLWWVIIIVGLIIIGIVILVGLLTRRSPASEQKCKSAEYPSKAENVSCDPNIVEVNLTASDNEVQILNGDRTKLYNYNDSFPGPLIEAKVGDELIVHFFNDLSEPSTVTWHGLQPNANQDGSIISQLPVLPGESFDYHFYLDTAGLFWYHSDVDARNQVHKGLYGVILVKDYDEDDCFSLPKTEKVLAFSDLKLNDKNQVWVEFSDEPCTRASEQINGILGNVLLTNGVHEGCIKLTKNEPTRLRLVNCATDRFMKIVIEDHDFLRIGGDQGLLEKPILVKQDSGLILTTGERADIVFVPRHEKVRIYTYNPRGIQHVEKDCEGNFELVDKITFSDEKHLLVTFETDGSEEVENLEVPLELKCIKRIKVDQCTPVIPVSFGNFPPNEKGDVDFFAYKIGKDGIPFECLNPEEAPVIFEGNTYIIEVTNYSDIANNFFLHGFTFQHLDTLQVTKQGVHREINKVLENKDTIYIPPKPEGYKSKTVVRLAVKFSGKGRNIHAVGGYPTEHKAGGWIFQSHMLTHAELGQQGYIQIVGECDRKSYGSHSGYLNTYSSYTDSQNHTTCLTKSSRVYGSTSLTKSLDELSKSLITCSCGSGLSSSLCSCSMFSNKSSCSKSKSKYFTESSLSYSTDSSSKQSRKSQKHSHSYDSYDDCFSDNLTDSKSLQYPPYQAPSSCSSFSSNTKSNTSSSSKSSSKSKRRYSDSSLSSTYSCSTELVSSEHSY